MAEEATETGAKKKGGLLPLVIGVVLALVLGGATAYAVMSGLLAPPFELQSQAAADDDAPEEEAEEVVFVEFEPLELTIGGVEAPKILRLGFAIETTPDRADLVESMRPRVLDALNTLLRAIDDRDLADPAALDRVRAQMARRVRLSIDPGAVRDLLIMQYVIL